ncbi:MAG TPA: NAD(P)/FAD-dependent oxidoreductase [Alphaproteobacteria bacterium]|nr:NAD(P)/FAD-dependent oxidoreductase [Alphaproteobacteria bacterium]
MDTTPSERHRIVIVGGGAGGLELATKLGDRLGRRGRADIVLVDAEPTHLWKPLLHEVAAGTLNSYQDELNYIAHARGHHFRYRFGRMSGLDRVRKNIILAPVLDDDGREAVPSVPIPYDTLIIAVGSVSNDFNTPGAREFCQFLDDRVEAERLHRDLLIGVLAAVAGPRAAGVLDVAIIGGGATGVELAAELRSMGEELSKYGVPIDPDALRITVIEAAPRVLPVLPERLGTSVADALRGIGVRILAGARVAQIDERAVHLADGTEVPAQIKVWAAGIKAPDFLRNIDGLESNRAGQLVVRRTLQTTRDDDVFAFGDCAACPQPGTDQPVPARAQAAHQQASMLAKSMVRRLDGKPLPEYTYRDFGSLVSLSRYTALGTIMGGVFRHSHRIEGRIARFAYISLYRMHQMALHGLWRTAILILTNRLQRVTQPSLKMH